MISKELARTFVCLRCRLQLAGASSPRQFRPLRPASHQNYLALWRRLGTGSAAPREEAASNDVEVDWRKLDSSEAIDTDAIERELQPEERKEVRAFLKGDALARKVFQARDETPLSSGEDLSVDVLGKAAHTIILRQREKGEPRGKPTVEESPLAVQQVDLAATLERENTDPDLAEIIKNIHELQPLTTRVLPDLEFKALRLILSRGFTKEQLSGYIHYTRTAVDFETGNRPPWILHQSLWKPQRPDGVPSGALPKTVQDMPRKEKLVERLMDECWGLVPESKQDSDGYIDIWLRDDEFGLLVAGNKRWLNQIARYFKDFPRQIELFPSKNVLRIVATKVIAEAMLEEINEILALKKTVTHKQSLISAEPIATAILDQVGKLTNTVVKLEPGEKEITIAWIHKVRHLEDHEELGDVVLRFLLASFGPRQKRTKMLTAKPYESLQNGRYIVDCENLAMLSWKDRQRQWARWVAPSSRKAVSQRGGKLPKAVLQQLLDFENKFATRTGPHAPIETGTGNSLDASPTTSSETKPNWPPESAADNAQESAPENTQETVPESAQESVRGDISETAPANISGHSTKVPVGAPPEGSQEALSGMVSQVTEAPPVLSPPKELAAWSRHPQKSTRAVFGHILHATKLPAHVLASRATALDSSLDYTFIPVVPPLKSLQFDRYYERDRPRHSTLLLRFLPAPDQDVSLSQASPPLELRLEMDGNDLRRTLSLRAVVDTFIASVMYPQCAVDVRVSQERFYELAGRDMESGQMYAAPMLDFINASTLQADSGNLRTPPRLVGLPIPRRLLRPKKRRLIPGEGNDDETDFIRVDYRFSGLEIQRTVAAEHAGYTLRYRQVEAGQHGGNWSEIALDEAVPADAFSPAPKDAAPREYQAETFLKAVSAMVSKQGELLWQGRQKRVAF
ncbi:hypothetical protein GQ53DRAFT_340792 [Thozetella sp. PMI_491]|nr:hypothetical protein GQ53DRAFT_340792 [Thozetella sp. PMI_491]